MGGSWRGVSLVTGWQLTASLAFYSVFAATAFIREQFGLSRAVTGLSITAVMLGYTLLLFATGAGVDAFGERPLMIGGLLGLGGGMAGVAAVSHLGGSYPLLLAALAVLGLAYATAMPATNRAALVVAPEGQRNLAMNVKQVGVTAGSGASAVLITNFGASRWGWEGGFLAGAALCLVVASVFAWRYDGRPGAGELSVPDVRGLLDQREYRGLVVAGVFFGAAVFTTTGYVVLHMTESTGAAAGVAGAVLAAVQVTGSAGRLAGGAISDRLSGPPERGPALVLVGQGVLAAACFLLVAAVDSRLATAGAFALLGLFILGFPGVYYATMTALVDDDEVGAATAGGQTLLNVGGLAAPPLFGLVADLTNYDTSWTITAGVVLVASAVVYREILR